jgi:hypothetical protein
MAISEPSLKDILIIASMLLVVLVLYSIICDKEIIADIFLLVILVFILFFSLCSKD